MLASPWGATEARLKTEAAEMVLADDNFASIVAALRTK
jgi:hypothetical protein